MKKIYSILVIVSVSLAALNSALAAVCIVAHQKDYYYCDLVNTNYDALFNHFYSKIEAIAHNKGIDNVKQDANSIGPHISLSSANLPNGLMLQQLIGKQFSVTMSDNITLWSTRDKYWFVTKISPTNMRCIRCNIMLLSPDKHQLHVSIAEAEKTNELF